MQTAPLFTFAPWMYFIAAPLAALGFIGLYCSLLKGRAKGRLRCPKCWYDMAGRTPPATCPECGRTAATLKDLQRTRRHWRAALLALLLTVPLGVVFGKLHAARVYYAVMPKWKLDQKLSMDGTTISTYEIRDPDAIGGSRVIVSSNGKTLIDREDFSATVHGFNFAQETFIDLNNDGIKEAVVEFYSGGAHCCCRAYILELRPGGAAIVADIDAQNGLAIKPPAAGRFEWTINIPDQSFDYWRASHAESSMPPVYYRLQDGALRLVLESLDMQRWHQDSLDVSARMIKQEWTPQTVDPPPRLVRLMLTLLYAGHDDQAWALVDLAWQDSANEKAKFLREFKEVLANDPWYQDLLAARAARAAGQAAPPSIVGMSGRAADAANEVR